MGKTAVDEKRVTAAKSALKVPAKAKKTAAKKVKVVEKPNGKKKNKVVAEKIPRKTKSVRVSAEKQPRKVIKPRKVRVLNDMPFRKFGKDLARSLGVSNMTEEAKETFNGLVEDLTESVLRRLITATDDLNTIKDRHVTNVVCQEVIARRHGRNGLVPHLIQTAAEVGQRYAELYPTAKKTSTAE
jgi:hypothetical protein